MPLLEPQYLQANQPELTCSELHLFALGYNSNLVDCLICTLGRLPKNLEEQKFKYMVEKQIRVYGHTEFQ